tara:strand:+ start:306 stop:506 length:201 start_codon:yes stop_codon:yes gene_type:complete
MEKRRRRKKKDRNKSALSLSLFFFFFSVVVVTTVFGVCVYCLSTTTTPRASSFVSLSHILNMLPYK